jgi:hypothetical protein
MRPLWLRRNMLRPGSGAGNENILCGAAAAVMPLSPTDGPHGGFPALTEAGPFGNAGGDIGFIPQGDT